MRWYWWGKDRESGQWRDLEAASGSYFPIGPKIRGKKQKTEFRPHKHLPHDLGKSPFWSEFRLAAVHPDEEVQDDGGNQS